MRIHIMTEKQLLRVGWDLQVKAAHQAYWQGREDERHNIDSPYFNEPTESELNRTPMPKCVLDAFKEERGR